MMGRDASVIIFLDVPVQLCQDEALWLKLGREPGTVDVKRQQHVSPRTLAQITEQKKKEKSTFCFLSCITATAGLITVKRLPIHKLKMKASHSLACLYLKCCQSSGSGLERKKNITQKLYFYIYILRLYIFKFRFEDGLRNLVPLLFFFFYIYDMLIVMDIYYTSMPLEFNIL